MEKMKKWLKNNWVDLALVAVKALGYGGMITASYYAAKRGAEKAEIRLLNNIVVEMPDGTRLECEKVSKEEEAE